MRRARAHKSHKVLWSTLGAAAVIVGGFGIGTYHYVTADKFLPNTSISGVNVGNLSAKQAGDAITKELSNRKIKLTDGNNDIKNIDISDTGITVKSPDSLESSIKSQKSWSWPLKLTKVVQAKDSVKLGTAKVDEAKLDKFVDRQTKELNKNRKPSTLSKIQVAPDGSAKLIRGKQGNAIGETEFKTNIKKAVATGSQSIDLKQSYEKSTAKKSDQLANQVEKIDKVKANYDIAGKQVTISNKLINTWLKVEPDAMGAQSLSLNETAIKQYLDKLSDKYGTYKEDITFKSTKQGTQTVKGGNYGWLIDSETDAHTLAQKLLAGKDFTQKATITGSGQNEKRGQLGNTYVEVDKKNQHMWFYKNGKLVISTRVVTGNPPKQVTPSGVWFVWRKEQNATLKGKNDDGSNYASPVKYWMPIDYTGVGLHDAPWQPTFGGDWYKTHGSHGCVNTPPDVMPKLYAAVPLGTPVVVIS